MSKAAEYLKKIEQAQAMLDEVKADLLKEKQVFDDSIQRGESDIADGRVTRCETQKELDHYFESL